MTDGNGAKPKFFTFNIGHLLTLIAIVGTANGVWMRLELKTQDNATRLDTHRERIVKIETDKGADARDIKGTLEDIQRRLARIEGQLERRP